MSASRRHVDHVRFVAVALGAVVALLVTGCSGSSGHPRVRSGSAATPTATATPGVSRPAAVRLTARLARWRLPAARSREVATGTAAGIVVAGGLSSAQVSTSTVWTLDPATGRLVHSASLADPVHDAAGAVLGRRPLVIAGGNTTTVASVQRIGTAPTARVIGNLPQPRSDLVATSLGRDVYVLAGFDGVTSLAPVLRTSDGRRFTTVARLPVTVRYPAMVSVAATDGDRLLVFGGEHDGVVVDDVQEIDVRTGRARVVGHLPMPLAHETAFVLVGQVWLVGGRSHSVIQSRIWRWDPRQRRALRSGHLPYAVADAPVALAGSTAYVLGGETPDPTDRVVTLRPR